MNEGWVWLSDHDFAPRSIIKIKNNSNGAVVYCEALEIDDNFTQQYNQAPRINIAQGENTIVINGWYRSRLGEIETQKNHDLEVSEANGLSGRFLASTGHPQVVVRLATLLGVISVVLGIVSIGLAFK
ncbi:MAG: hypothetical protein K8I04_14175 [Gammaproteobacteria bacterium]|nr:hypothetical protein [Gammaproteobacteria bacterium]